MTSLISEIKEEFSSPYTLFHKFGLLFFLILSFFVWNRKWWNWARNPHTVMLERQQKWNLERKIRQEDVKEYLSSNSVVDQAFKNLF